MGGAVMPRLTKIEPPPTDADIARAALTSLRDTREAVTRMRIQNDLLAIAAISDYLRSQVEAEQSEFPLAGLCEVYREYITEVVTRMALAARRGFAHEFAQGRDDSDDHPTQPQ